MTELERLGLVVMAVVFLALRSPSLESVDQVYCGGQDVGSEHIEACYERWRRREPLSELVALGAMEGERGTSRWLVVCYRPLHSYCPLAVGLPLVAFSLIRRRLRRGKVQLDAALSDVDRSPV